MAIAPHPDHCKVEQALETWLCRFLQTFQTVEKIRGEHSFRFDTHEWCTVEKKYFGQYVKAPSMNSSSTLHKQRKFESHLKLQSPFQGFFSNEILIF